VKGLTSEDLNVVKDSMKKADDYQNDLKNDVIETNGIKTKTGNIYNCCSTLKSKFIKNLDF
jgi:hypothetical protein